MWRNTTRKDAALDHLQKSGRGARGVCRDGAIANGPAANENETVIATVTAAVTSVIVTETDVTGVAIVVVIVAVTEIETGSATAAETEIEVVITEIVENVAIVEVTASVGEEAAVAAGVVVMTSVRAVSWPSKQRIVLLGYLLTFYALDLVRNLFFLF